MWSAFGYGEDILTIPSELFVHIFAVYMFIYQFMKIWFFIVSSLFFVVDFLGRPL